jgi:mRNA interferase MazF
VVTVRQGELYWLDLGAPTGSEPAYRHPHVVVQNDVFNRSRIRTTVVCAVTSNLGRAGAPGNVRLEVDEAGLPKASVVNVSQLLTVDKEELTERIGELSPLRVREVVSGIELLLEPREPPEAQS